MRLIADPSPQFAGDWDGKGKERQRGREHLTWEGPRRATANRPPCTGAGDHLGYKVVPRPGFFLQGHIL